jgi:hypothetical protein
LWEIFFSSCGAVPPSRSGYHTAYIITREHDGRMGEESDRCGKRDEYTLDEKMGDSKTRRDI